MVFEISKGEVNWGLISVEKFHGPTSSNVQKVQETIGDCVGIHTAQRIGLTTGNSQIHPLQVFRTLKVQGIHAVIPMITVICLENHKDLGEQIFGLE